MRAFSILLLLVASVTVGFADKRVSDPGPHPLRLLKVIVEDNGSNISGTRGVAHVWIHNASDVAVDKCKMEIDLYNRDGRQVEKVMRDLGTIDPGKKKLEDVKWSVIGEGHLKPRIWLFYNGGLDRLTQFEAPPSE